MRPTASASFVSAGIDVVADQLRAYPHGSLAAHVIGFSGVDEQGMEGIERVLDEEIRGESITRKVCKDARGRVWLDRGGLPGMNQGATVELTIDTTLQSLAEAELARQIEEMDADGGSVVMLDPRTGEVLAMANAPTFDPNHYSTYGPERRRDRAVTDTFEPGSTMKPFVVAAALDSGVIRETDRFDCENGLMRVQGWPIRDHHPYKILSVSEIIQVSSNICSVKIGAKVGRDRLYDYLKSFGFARRTGIETPGEVSGKLEPASKWREINLANISFGQGVTVTAVQLATAMGTLANGGVRMLPLRRPPRDRSRRRRLALPHAGVRGPRGLSRGRAQSERHDGARDRTRRYRRARGDLRRPCRRKNRHRAEGRGRSLQQRRIGCRRSRASCPPTIRAW